VRRTVTRRAGVPKVWYALDRRCTLPPTLAHPGLQSWRTDTKVPSLEVERQQDCLVIVYLKPIIIQDVCKYTGT
jgi:hypothetical protein